MVGARCHDFVHRDRNHPGVVIWSAGNEVVDQVVPAGTVTLKRLINIFHREDPTRPVTVGCDRIAAEPDAVPQKFLNLLDVVGYNYVDRWRDRYEKYYSTDRQLFRRENLSVRRTGHWAAPAAIMPIYSRRNRNYHPPEQ